MNGYLNAIASAALLAAVAGCAVSEANRAQEEIAAKAAGLVEIRAADHRFDFRKSSLRELVDFAMTNRPSVVSARLAVDDARLALKALAADAPLVSRTPWTSPDLSVRGGHSEASQLAKLDEMDWSTEGGPSASLSLDLLIWDFGRYDARAHEQTEKVLAAEKQLTDTGYQVFYEVSQAYFNFMEKRSLREVYETNLVNYAEHLARAEARLRAGEACKLDVLRARLDLAQARQELVAVSNQVDTAGATLMSALGVDASNGTSAAVFGDEPIGIDRVFCKFRRTGYDVDTAFALARTNAPIMMIRRAQLRASSHAVDLAKRDLLPSISASASLSWTNPEWGWNWGVSIVQSLFQGFRRTTAIERSVVAMRQAAAAVDQAEQELSVDIETAIANRDNSVQALESAVVSLRSAHENLNMINEQFSVGDVSRIELSEAIYSFTRATGDSIVAFYDGQRAEAKLFALLGIYPDYHEKIIKGH